MPQERKEEVPKERGQIMRGMCTGGERAGRGQRMPFHRATPPELRILTLWVLTKGRALPVHSLRLRNLS